MNVLFLHPSAFTPMVNLNAGTGVLELTGRSTSENALDFYHPILAWIKEYTKNPMPVTTLNLQLDYFNSSSSKCLLDILKNISRVQSKDNQVMVNWHYQSEDVDMRETGEDLESLVKVNFNLIEIKN
jgi:hypothetical protein